MIKSAISVLLFLFTSCINAAENKIIAFSQDTMANDFRKAQVLEVQQEIAKHPGFTFIYSDGRSQTSLMIQQIDRFIKQKVDALILGTNDEKAIVPIITKAYQAGIPVILLDRGILSDNYTTFIQYDNRKIGRIAGRYIVEKLNGKGNVLLLEGVPNTDVTKLRSAGFYDIINQYPEIKATSRIGNFLRKDALVETEKLIKQGQRFDAIFAESDSMLSGVRLVLQRYKINPASIISVGVDFITEAQQAINSGQQSATVTYPLGGVKAAILAMGIINGNKVAKNIPIKSQLITRKNVNTMKPIF